MIKTWPGQTKEEWLKERERDASLTPEERKKEMDEYVKHINEKWDKYYTNQVNKTNNRESIETPFKKCDHPNSLENSEATIVWIVVMVVGSMFRGNWLIWIIATIIWLKYITRHKIKK